MDFEILGWESKGLRCPNGKVDLCVNGSKKINLIQMPSGTGKTTYLELIRGALSGSILTLHTNINQFRDDINVSNEGYFKLSTKCKDEAIDFELNFNFKKNTVEYMTSSPLTGGSMKGWKPPDEFRRLFQAEFVNLFIYDGEYARKLTKPKEKVARNCVDALCKLHIFSHIQSTMDRYYEHNLITNKLTGAKTTAGLKKITNNILNLEERIKNQKLKLEENDKIILMYTKSIKNIENQIKENRTEDINKQKEYNEAVTHLNKCEAEYLKRTREIFEMITKPQVLDDSLGKSLKNFKSNLEKLKIPANVTRQFFEELKEEKNCICDREISSKEIEAINRNKDKYLDEDTAGIYNAIKTDIAKYVEEEQSDNFQTLDNLINFFKTSLKDKDKAKTHLEAIEDSLNKEATDDMKALQEELRKNKNDLEKITNETRIINASADTGDEKSKSIKELEKIKKDEEKKRSQIAGNVKLERLNNQIKGICKEIQHASRDNIKLSLVDQCNFLLEKIMKASPIRVKSIDEYISLTGINEKFLKDEGSQGQTLSVGYCFLTSLLNRGNYNLPLMIDSPCGRIDHGARAQIAAIIPSLSNQFITFVQSSERANFTEVLENLSNSVNHVTIFNKVIFDKDKASLPNIPKNAIKTDDAFIIHDQKFFNEFDEAKGIQ